MGGLDLFKIFVGFLNQKISFDASCQNFSGLFMDWS